MTTQRKRKAGHRASSMLLANIPEDRILELSNDLSEGIASGTVREWRRVAEYFRNHLDRAHNDINAIRPSVAAYVTGMELVAHSKAEMSGWLKRVLS